MQQEEANPSQDREARILARRKRIEERRRSRSFAAERSGKRLVSGSEIEELYGGEVGENNLTEVRSRSFVAERSGRRLASGGL